MEYPVWGTIVIISAIGLSSGVLLLLLDKGKSAIGWMCFGVNLVMLIIMFSYAFSGEVYA